MKRKNIFRVLGIGTFHAVLYLYIVPFVLYPKFGDMGFKFAAIVAVTVSAAVIGTIVFEKFFRGDKNESYKES